MLGLSLVLLTVAFRSVVIAGTAIVLNLLSVGAAYGLMVLVFQQGVGADLFGFQQVDTIEAWVPLFLFAVLFGLSMDYQVFLLSRIRERYTETGDTTEAVVSAVGRTARIITGAALIIVAVFIGFAAGELVMFQQMGFGVAVALLIDATIVRSVLVPATMTLLGKWNWYLPRWLDWLPHVGVEGRPPPAPPAWPPVTKPSTADFKGGRLARPGRRSATRERDRAEPIVARADSSPSSRRSRSTAAGDGTLGPELGGKLLPGEPGLHHPDVSSGSLATQP